MNDRSVTGPGILHESQTCYTLTVRITRGLCVEHLHGMQIVRFWDSGVILWGQVYILTTNTLISRSANGNSE